MSKKRDKKILVVKIGTGELLGEDGKLDQKKFDCAARQIVRLQEKGISTAIVTSGAIRAGKEIMARVSNHAGELDDKSYAGIGTIKILAMWSEAFGKHKKAIAQFWVTYANWKKTKERENIRAGILECCANGVIPVMNENDVIASEEIEKFRKGIGENDHLAEMQAKLIEADFILFLTEIGGIFEKDPRHDQDARMYKTINAASIRRTMANSNTKSQSGTGGIKAKLKAALACYKFGIKRVGIAGLTDNSIINFVQENKPVGTTIGKEVNFY